MKREYLPIETLSAWTRLNGISVDGVTFRKVRTEDGIDKGCAIVATGEKSNESSETGEVDAETLLRVPSDLILSLRLVETHAKSDRYLREVLDAVGDFGRTARGAILIFLVLQITYSSPDFADEHHRIGVSNPWTEYIQYLPSSITLPTFYTVEERELLRGTSLKLAVDAKIVSLENEFELLRQSTENISWCRKHWWDENTGRFTLDDWKYVDAMYRSRMVDLPSSGHAMVPCIDMANHASEDIVKALYEEDTEGNAVLQLRSGRKLHSDEEVTISYGDDKPASEMIFSYGFLENERGGAKQIFLNLDIPEDDPLIMAKKRVCKAPPGLRLFDAPTAERGSTDWDSPFVWWLCVNQEDGLEFEVLQTNDGGREVKVSWKGEEIKDPNDIKSLLAKDPLWDIFQLRAVVTVLDRLESHFLILRETQIMVEEINHNEDMLALFRPEVYNTINSLRELEGKLLEKGIEDLVQQRQDLMASEAVAAYLTQQQADDVEEDFS
ncbi:hypothetical protein AFCA_007237 [Aspergillus flavus]|uniref:SET domain protein n=4 Tax=Aspergillus subgen. Circumdati TaxID=2720871 RepID=A0A1S9DQK6_ASPOZ|nr:SET domain protein [Aspergillus flavus AF70]OOO11254.1 hypothetical protein OAory_01077240 [Aspergillus oryzae]RMZ47149.1 SET domain protein [Aspergillus flavus]UDD59814.1 hypothetical protein AFCA_007237 [Aspergillus flavus]